MKTFTIMVMLALARVGVNAAEPVIGTVRASGEFRLNGDTVIANGTVTEGAVIDTGRSNSSVRLTQGAVLFFGTESRAKLYSSRMVLEKGETRFESGTGFHLESLGLTIRPDRGPATGQIGVLGKNRLRVAVLAGSVRVLNLHGTLVANVAAGSALAFEPQTPSARILTHITGILVDQNGHFLLTDRVTHVTVEITGQGLPAVVGRLVQVTGSVSPDATPVAGATEVIAATQVQTVGAQPGSGAAAAGAGGATSGGAIGITTVAILGGVAVAATLGGLAASGALSNQSQPVSR